MPRGPYYFESKGACIYCGAAGGTLTDEHIVPYSLGGSHVIRKASCLGCADITKKFEQKVTRDLWGDARAAFNAPTRRKKDRKTHIKLRDPEGRSEDLLVPMGEYPAGFVFYWMDKAGFLVGAPDTEDRSASWQLRIIDDSTRRKQFVAKHPGRLTIRFRHVPQEFGRLLAKIGYGHVLSSLDPGDFRPICLPYILGEKPNVSYVVGGSLDDQRPDPDNGYFLGTGLVVQPERVVLIALIRLYANTHAPAYHVVVGDVMGADNINRVLRKIGPINPAPAGPGRFGA